MSGGSHIVAIGGGEHQAAPADVETSQADDAALPLAEELEEEAPAPLPRPWGRWIAATLALAAVATWTGFFTWANLAAIEAGTAPLQWIGWIRDWATPVLLIGVCWLIVLRHSTREARRFNDAARLLGDESARLEARLTSVNGELSLAREFIAAQSRDLETLGRVATERLSQHADKLANLIKDNSTRLDAIGSVSESALDNMEKLRGQLPVIASSAKDVTNNIGNAGRTAHTQLEGLITGFNRLNEFGQASETQVQSLRGKIDEALAEFARQTDQFGTIAEQRFAALASEGEAFRGKLDAHEVEALASVRSRAAALSEELAGARAELDSSEAESLTSLRSRLTAMREESGAIARSVREGESAALEAWGKSIAALEGNLREAIAKVTQIDTQALEAARARLAALAEEAAQVDARLVERDRLFAEQLDQRHQAVEERHAGYVAQLNERMADVDAAIAARHAAHEERTSALAAHGEALAGQLDVLAARMREAAEQGGEARDHVAGGLEALAAKLGASREALDGTDKAIAQLTDGSVRLLELLQGSVRFAEHDLPAAMGASEASLGELEQRALMLRDTVSEAGKHGEALSAYVIESREGLAGSLEQLDGLHGALAERAAGHAATLAELHEGLQRAQAQSAELSEQAQGELRNAIAALEDQATKAVGGIEGISAAAITSIAQKLSEESGAAIEKAMRTRAAEAAGALELAAAHAAGVSREAAVQLRDQLAKVSELAGQLERRVAQARERAEEQVDNDFARRVALITEALRSNAIDITRALDVDVADTAWASYLKGDRGIFTRRAVKLLDAGEVKEVAQLYSSDRAFREHVSRYIHDFEAMLRQLLSTRDGHALGVTLLSSDMGKLYVAMAQAIERLRN